MKNATKSESLSSKLRKLTKQELNTRDVFGRTILHIICIVGRFDLLKHLLKNPNLNAFITDHESGWTGLHYSIFYGRLSCARLLLDHNYDLVKFKDRVGLTAMDIYHLKYSYKDLKIFPTSIGKDDTNYSQRFDSKNSKIQETLTWWDKDHRGGSELYTFGVNVNNQLGTGDSVDKSKVPYRVDIDNFRVNDFSLSIADRLVKPRIKDIKISKNHSIVLVNEHKNNILISGNPSRGRLGSNTTIPNYRFIHMDYFADEHIVEVALSDDHSLALTSDGDVYSWGLNNFYELGYTTEKIKEKLDTFSSEPRRVLGCLKKLKVEGVSCSQIHSIAYVDNSLVLWGLNVGQMDLVSTGETVKFGKLKGIIQVPRKLEFTHSIKQVIATNEATIILLANDECHVLTNGNHLRFQIPLYKTLNNEFEFFRPTKFSKKKTVIKLVSKDETKIGILYDDGSVSNFGVDFSSKSSNIKFNNIWTPRSNHLKAIDVDIGKDGSVIICTRAGSVYKRITRHKGTSDFKFTKIDRLSKIVKVSCDSLFSSFGFIKDDIDQLPLKLVKNKFLVDMAYLSPLSSSQPNRKQTELINTSQNAHYDANFLHRPCVESADDEVERLFQNKFKIVDDKENQSEDCVYDSYIKRWDSSQQLKSTYQIQDDSTFSKLLTREDLKYYLNSGDHLSYKDYDLRFDVDDCLIGVHKSVLFMAPIFKKLEVENLEFEGIEFRAIDEHKIIKVTNIHIHSLLIILHLLYTGRLLKPWEEFSAGALSGFLKDIKTQILYLLQTLQLTDALQKSTFDFQNAFMDRENFDNDVTLLLKDGEELECCSYILKARNAYFETFFSERWDDSLWLDFQHIRKEVFEVVLDYIYGHDELTLLDSMHELSHISDFINFQFELLEISDELLLFGLKDLSQLMIKDFISHDNVLVILHHAETLDCQKLIGECLWFIYNNVDSFLIDPNYGELLTQTMIKKIDSYCRWFNRVNKADIQDTKGAWYDGNSDHLISSFFNDIRSFNDIFLESDDFVPLFDIPEKKKLEKASPKLEAKTIKAPSVSLSAERKKSVSILIPQTPSRKSSVSDSSAIEFTEDEFQPVINSRRRRSSANTNRRGSSVTSTPSSALGNTSISNSTPSKSSPIPINNNRSSHTYHSNNSNESFNKNTWSTPNISSSPSGMSPSSSWALSGSIGSPSGGKAWTDSTYTTKAALSAPPRLSQKERKRMLKSNVDADFTKPKVISPWMNVSANNTSSSLNFPSLASAQAEASASEAATPSLKGIIHEEEHRIFESKAKEKERRSLAEIQQEEEFAQWWEEESKRVQTQVNSLNDKLNTLDKSNGQKNSKHRKKSGDFVKKRKNLVSQ